MYYVVVIQGKCGKSEWFIKIKFVFCFVLFPKATEKQANQVFQFPIFLVQESPKYYVQNDSVKLCFDIIFYFMFPPTYEWWESIYYLF